MWQILWSFLAPLVIDALTPEDCTKGYDDACNIEVTMSIPPSREVLDSRCPKWLQQDKPCTIAYDAICAPDVAYPLPGQRDSVFSAWEDLCRDGTYLRNMFLKNPSCLFDIMNNTFTICQSEYTDFMEKYLSTAFSKKYPDEDSCMSLLFRIDCVLSAVKNQCFPEAKDFLSKFYKDMYLFYSCEIKQMQEVVNGIDMKNKRKIRLLKTMSIFSYEK